MKGISEYKLPNLYIPGAGKSGTSSLHEFLAIHPEICMSSEKEPHFWTSPDFESFTNDDFEKYSALFHKKEAKFFGESSTAYFCFPDFIDRVKKHSPKTPKFIILLRNPVSRAYSHYWWLKGMGSENLSFKQALTKDMHIEPTLDQKLPEANFKNYFQFGLYGKWVSKFYDAFGKSNIHIITSEDLKEDPLHTVNSCFEFLGLEPVTELPTIIVNETTLLMFPKLYKHTKKLVWGNYKITKLAKPFFSRHVKTKMKSFFLKKVFETTRTNRKYPQISPEDKNWLTKLYVEDVEKLKIITGLSYSKWKDFH